MDCLFDWELLTAIQSVSQRFALDIGHDVIKNSVASAGVEERENVRMIEPRRELDFAQEAIGSQR